jgi:hypothetical protein
MITRWPVRFLCLPISLFEGQIVVHHIKRISFSLAEVLRFGIAC